MKKSASNFFSAKSAAASAIAVSAIAFPLSAQAASDPHVSAQPLTLQSNDVERAALRGIIQGDAQGNLAENRALTRGEFAVLVARAFGLDLATPAVSSYKDLKTSSWVSPAAEALRAKGWMSGNGNAFLPTAPVTQEQMAVVLAKALDLANEPIQVAGAGIADESLASASTWAKESLTQAASAGLLGVYATGIKPGQQVLRGEAASAVLAASNLQTQNIEAVQDGVVKVGGVAYSVSSDLAGLFAASNASALTGANVKVTISGGVVTAVRSLELNAAGQAAAEGKAEFSGNTALNGGGSKIEGSVTVNGDFFTLNELAIGGDLTISSKVKHDFLSAGLVVKGQTNVLGGDENTVVFDNAQLNTLTVNKPDVHVDFKGSIVPNIVLLSNTTLTGDSESKISEVVVDPKASLVHINASIGTLNILGVSKIALENQAKISNVILPSNFSPSSIFENFNAVAERISRMNGQLVSFFVQLPVVNPTLTPTPTSSNPIPVVPPAPVINKSALESSIADAELSLTEAPVGDKVGEEYPKWTSDALNVVLAESKEVFSDVSASQQAVDASTTKLTAATKTLRESKNYTQITRSSAQARLDFADLSAGTGPKQVSQEIYDAFQNGLASIEGENVDPLSIDPLLEEQLLNQLLMLKENVVQNLVAWDISALENDLAAARQALIDHAGNEYSRAQLGVYIQSAETLLAQYASKEVPVLQTAVDSQSRNLKQSTTDHLNKNNQSIPLPPNFPNPIPTLPPVPTPTPEIVIPPAAGDQGNSEEQSGSDNQSGSGQDEQPTTGDPQSGAEEQQTGDEEVPATSDPVPSPTPEEVAYNEYTDSLDYV